MRRFSILTIALLSQLLIGGALAANPPAGKAVGVNPSASNVVDKVTRTLTVGADVAMGDKIVTDARGQVQLVFSDDTHLVVGPNSSLLIESYLLRTDKSVGQFAVNALGGTFRFITGKSDHSAYLIDTPTGTIGVRGTAFDFTVAPPGARFPTKPGQFLPGTTVALFRGAVVLCNLANKCVTLSRQCDVGTITTPNTQKIGPFDKDADGLRARFRYILSQKPLLHDFWINESRLCLIDTSMTNSLAGPGTGGSLGAAPAPPPRRICITHRC